jgi:hypothetical protein
LAIYFGMPLSKARPFIMDVDPGQGAEKGGTRSHVPLVPCDTTVRAELKGELTAAGIFAAGLIKSLGLDLLRDDFCRRTIAPRRSRVDDME